MSESKHILIVSNAFYPELSPRAFRTTELARELARRGNRVSVVLPNREIYRNNPVAAENLTVLFGTGPEEKTGAPPQGRARQGLRSLLPRFLVRWILYFYNHELFMKYDRGLARRLLLIDEPCDAVISVSYPAAVHRAVSRALKRNPNLARAVKIAEFSDPPFRGDIARTVFPGYYRYLRRWGRQFDYIVVPVENAVAFYTPYIDSRKIRVIPQGFDFSAIRTFPYEAHDRPTFAYAGRFYEHIRDPRYFFDFLRGVGRDFRFELYLNHIDPCFAGMIERARQEVPGEIVLHAGLPREELIARLSRMDFLVNFENATSNASPSKLIDYALTGRPILSVCERNFNPQAVLEFMDKNYSAQVRGIDLQDYDIRNVADKFSALIG